MCRKSKIDGGDGEEFWKAKRNETKPRVTFVDPIRAPIVKKMREDVPERRRQSQYSLGSNNNRFNTSD